MRSNLKLVTTFAAGIALTTLGLAACSSDESSPGTGGGNTTCWPDHASCGLAGVGEECVAWHDNAGSDVLTFRMSQLEVLKPDVLAGEFLQNNVVSKGISLNLAQCYQEGTGRFTWLMELDKTAGTAKTGGAHVQLNPGDGYCYINQEVEGFSVSPVTVPIETTETDGEITFNISEKIPDLTVAIFLTDDESQAIILPLHGVLMTNGKISADGNCIGSWKGDELEFDNNCKPDRDQKMPWINNATLTGYIEIEEADTVWIPEMTQTLCVALSGSGSTYGEDFVEGDREGLRCRRENGKIVAAEKADWCSATDSACAAPDADAFRLEGQFAASAIKVLDACP
jgi:hypothetical protein